MSIVASSGNRLLFVSYSRKDGEWLSLFQDMFKPLRRQYKLLPWDDTEIRPGDQWEKKLTSALAAADAALLLVTPNFLASDYISEKELPYILEAERVGDLRLFWVAVSSSMYEFTELVKYQAVNDPQTPLDRLSPAELNKELVRVCTEILQTMSRPDPPGGDPGAPASPGQIVSGGLLALTSLTLASATREGALDIRTELQALGRAIESVGDRAAAHDFLFELQRRIESLLAMVRVRPGEAPPVKADELSYAAKIIHETALRALTRGLAIPRVIEREAQELREAAAEDDQARCMETLRRLEHEVTSASLRESSELFAAMRSLDFTRMASVMSLMLAGLRGSAVGAERAREFSATISLLEGFSLRMKTIIDEFDLWSTLDAEIQYVMRAGDIESSPLGLALISKRLLKSLAEFKAADSDRPNLSKMSYEAERLAATLDTPDDDESRLLFAMLRARVRLQLTEAYRRFARETDDLVRSHDMLVYAVRAMELSAAA